jgi:hypothetical protein
VSEGLDRGSNPLALNSLPGHPIDGHDAGKARLARLLIHRRKSNKKRHLRRFASGVLSGSAGSVVEPFRQAVEDLEPQIQILIQAMSRKKS